MAGGAGYSKRWSLLESGNLRSLSTHVHFLDEKTETQRLAHPEDPLAGLETRAGSSPVACAGHVLGIGRSQGGLWGTGAAHAQTEGAESSVAEVLSAGSAVDQLCGWIVWWEQGEPRGLSSLGGQSDTLPQRKAKSSGPPVCSTASKLQVPGQLHWSRGNKVDYISPRVAGDSDKVGGGCVPGLWIL